MLRRWSTWAIIAGLIVWELWLYLKFGSGDFWIDHGDDPGADAAAAISRLTVWALAIGGVVGVGALLVWNWWRIRRQRPITMLAVAFWAVILLPVPMLEFLLSAG